MCQKLKTISKKQNTNIQKVNIQQRELFQHKYSLIQDSIDINLKDSEKQIQLLRPFIEELLKEMTCEVDQSSNEKIDLSKFNVSDLNKLKREMIGCIFFCPLCKRKCDNDVSTNHTQHSCKNGHQLRGMNGVLSNNQPSLFMCEEIEDNVEITTQETNTKRQWKDVQRKYNEWNFKDLSDKDIEGVKKKMMNVWNQGIGELVCLNLRAQLKNPYITFSIKINSQVAKVLQKERVHFILALDDSGSMNGDRWKNAKKGALSCINDILANPDAKVSVILFNHNARTVINCESVSLEKAVLEIQFQDGGTCFDKAFSQILNQINTQYHQNFKKHMILFYTDGWADYPSQAVQQFINLPLNKKQQIQLICCSEQGENSNATLIQIINDLKKAGIPAELKQNIQVDKLESVWTEVVSESYVKLRC